MFPQGTKLDAKKFLVIHAGLAPGQHPFGLGSGGDTVTLFKLDGPLAYARVDLIRDADGAPRLLELELTEPSLFFAHAEGSADRFAAALKKRLDR